jgi:hypothetical protein
MLPLLFLTSAIAVGYPMVVFEATLATTSLKLDSEIKVLGPLTRITIFLLGLYLALKVGDMVVRGTYVYLLDGTAQTNSLSHRNGLRGGRSLADAAFPESAPVSAGLFIACTMIVGGVLVNRSTCSWSATGPPSAKPTIRRPSAKSWSPWALSRP